MFNAHREVPAPRNEPVLSYAPNSPERAELKAALKEMAAGNMELKSIIGGKACGSDKTEAYVMPHDHQKQIGTLHIATEAQVHEAIDNALAAKDAWAAVPFEERAGIFLKAADLLAGRYRAISNAATMLGQSKTAHQAEIDAVCELCDFFRYNVKYARDIMAGQPDSAPGIWNQLDYRPLDGFVFAVSPFNFSSIAVNLPTAVALMGNVCVWKPSETQALSANVMMDMLKEAGLPDGVINMVHGPGPLVGDIALNHRKLGGVHFTGSTKTFQHMWSTVGQNIASYETYPRLVGETGGKDFIVAHESADLQALAVAITRGAFEYQGQKCSAVSRCYVPQGMWGALSEKLKAMHAELKVGDICDFTNFMGAVIDKRAFDKIKGYIDYAKESDEAEVILGGDCDDSKGYFIQPTVVLTTNPNFKLIQEEIFGPVVTIYCYADGEFAEVLELCDKASPYALTGAIFAREKAAVMQASKALRHTAGNFYINDKPTGAVVGQQPFGGGRASGTNDKAGSYLNLLRWTSPRTVKENFDPPRAVEYPFLAES